MDSVSSATTHLVSNNDWTTTKNRESSKFKKAMKLGIRIITEDALLRMISQGDATARKA